MQISNEEKDRLSKLGSTYAVERNRLRELYYKKLPLPIKDLINFRNGSYEQSYLFGELVSFLSNANNKPSDFVKAKMPQIFDGYLNKNHEQHLYFNIDHLSERIYSSGYYRRSLRTRDPEIIAMGVVKKIWRFAEYDNVPGDVCDYIVGKLPDEVLGYRLYHYNSSYILGDLIAAEIEFGNERLIRTIEDSINGENDVVIERAFFEGIMEAHNRSLYELLGKLLCAARLQEGLRQSICESMDEGTPEAFLYLLEVIRDNNFIRFSSVKRSLAVWLGFITDDASKLERVSDKMAEYVYDCLSDETKRNEYLNSEDPVKIHIALWSLGFYEVNDLIDMVHKLSETGTRHQILAVSYSLTALNNRNLTHRASKPLIKKYKDDLEIMAAYMDFFMRNCGLNVARKECTVSRFFGSIDEAHEYFEILRSIYDSISGRGKSFDPFIFPWYSAEITKAQVVIRMAYIASALGKKEYVDAVCTVIKDADVNYRGDILKALLAKPTTELQRKTLIAALCDKSEYVRKDAYEVVSEITGLLTKESYLQMEDMLRYKAADARANLIKLIMGQQDEELLGSISRLLSDSKEEKRCAALDMVKNLSLDEDRQPLFEKCLLLVKDISDPTTKEKILIDGIFPENAVAEEDAQEELFDESDKYNPVLPQDNCIKECVDVFMRYFPDSVIRSALFKEPEKTGLLGKIKGALLGSVDNAQSHVAKQTIEDIKALGRLVKAHERDEYDFYGEKAVIGEDASKFMRYERGHKEIPFMEVWKEYLDTNIKSPEQFLRMYLMNMPVNKWDDSESFTRPFAMRIYGKEFFENFGCDYPEHVNKILSVFLNEYVPKDDMKKLSIAILAYFTYAVPESELYTRYQSKRGTLTTKSICNQYLTLLLKETDRTDDGTMRTTFPMIYQLFDRHVRAYPEKEANMVNNYYKTSRYDRSLYPDYMKPLAGNTIKAAYKGVITKEQMYSMLFDEHDLGETLTFLTAAITAIREKDRLVSTRRFYCSWKRNIIMNELSAEEDEQLLKFIEEVYENVIGKVLSVELKRGDTSTKYSEYIRSIERVYGVKTFVAVLSALGKDTLERSTYHSTDSKKGALSRLLMVCIPDVNDDAESLRRELSGTDITEKRLVEASLYSPEWIDIVGEYLGWKGYTAGCYYFIAHMHESFDEKKKAVIAKFTPLSSEELMWGAFDVDWFKSVYEDLGEEKFNIIYDAAKYISDGAKHSRARKYADASLGRFDAGSTKDTIIDKRNKDLLMAYPLIPLKGEKDICDRYLYLQQFLKESKKFGSQRSSSEKQAVEIAMENLSINAGYSDVTRLTLRMETKLIEDMKELFEEKEIGETSLKLTVDDLGKVEISVNKAGKKLKSVPAAIKKDEYVKRLTEAKKKLTEQYKRTKAMFEQSMEERTLYSVEELDILRSNPVAEPVIRDLVFITESGDKLGFLAGCKLTDFSGACSSLKKTDNVRVAHTFDIYKEGHLSDYQKNLFDREIVQPFKQVFRELYVKTEEELEMLDTRRYSGNQIQPKKAIATLKSRRWTPDIEDGIQKVYYKENIIANIYAMADWFSPSDIEAPTLEWVCFYDRKSYKRLQIKEIPDIIFSEVMRDVDLAVSVAHAGGVDPQTSHSTIEMRAALVSFTLPLFKLSNVTIEGTHAHIKGTYGEYSVHLGSGVTHRMGGTMINILPVHSQHRGKLFLPFADEDPKTAEIITKILMLAQDKKIKDPSILSQLQ